MSLALRKRLEREYGKGEGAGATKKRRNEGNTEVEITQSSQRKRQRTTTKPLSLIRSILSTSANANDTAGIAKLSPEKADVMKAQEKKDQNDPASSSSQEQKQPKPRSKSPQKRKVVAKTCTSFQPLMEGVNGGTVVMRKRLEAEYGFRPAHQKKMGYFSYVAEAQGSVDKAMVVMEDTLEEDEEAVTKKVKAAAKKIATELTRARPDSSFLMRLVKGTMRHNKRVIEELEEMDRKKQAAQAEVAAAPRRSGIAALLRMFLEQQQQQQPGNSSAGGNGDEGEDNEGKASENSSSNTVADIIAQLPPARSRYAKALFGCPGTVLQRRLNKQYGLGGEKSAAKKKAEELATRRAREEEEEKRKKKTKNARIKPAISLRGGQRLLLRAFAAGSLSRVKNGKKKVANGSSTKARPIAAKKKR
eukprot:jgi/Bigna1/90259/estExt_fgenesh1_pg.C_660052